MHALDSSPLQTGLRSRRRLNHYQRLFHQAFAKSSAKVMEFTLMFGAEPLGQLLCFCEAQHFGLEVVSLDQSNVTAVMGHL